MSRIYSYGFGGVNPFDYLSALVAKEDQVRAHPEQWLPWNSVTGSSSLNASKTLFSSSLKRDMSAVNLSSHLRI